MSTINKYGGGGTFRYKTAVSSVATGKQLISDINCYPNYYLGGLSFPEDWFEKKKRNVP